MLKFLMWLFFSPLYLIVQNYQWHSNYLLRFSACDSLLQLLTLRLSKGSESLATLGFGTRGPAAIQSSLLERDTRFYSELKGTEV